MSGRYWPPRSGHSMAAAPPCRVRGPPPRRRGQGCRTAWPRFEWPRGIRDATWHRDDPYDTLKALREGVPPRELKNIAPPELMRRVTRADNYQQWTNDFLGGA